jgi:hypothetical protein
MRIRSKTLLLSLLMLPVLSGPAQAQDAQQEGDAAAPEAMAVPPPPDFPTPEARALLEDTVEGDLSQDLVLRFTPYFFPSFEGGTLFMLGFRVGASDLMFGIDAAALDATGGVQMGATPPEVAEVEVFGSIHGDGGEIRSFGMPLRVARDGVGDDGLSATHSFGERLPAGSYTLNWGIRDLVSGRASTVSQRLEVPDFTSGGIGLSSVLMVEGDPTGVRGAFRPGTVYEGVRVATASFTDHLVHEFSKTTGEVMLTYVVTGTQRDPATGVANFALSYQIRDAAGGTIWGTPALPHSRTTVGQPIRFADIEQVSAGNDYVFVIYAKDLAADADATTEVPFRLVR